MEKLKEHERLTVSQKEKVEAKKEIAEKVPQKIKFYYIYY